MKYILLIAIEMESVQEVAHTTLYTTALKKRDLPNPTHCAEFQIHLKVKFR